MRPKLLEQLATVGVERPVALTVYHRKRISSFAPGRDSMGQGIVRAAGLV